MKEIKGVYTSATVFTDDIEDYAAAQIKNICDNPIFKDSRIRIMPDVHPGKYCTIGTSMTIKDKVIPYLVGVDIGCGMTCVHLKARNMELQKLDSVIAKRVPSGMKIRNEIHRFAGEAELDRLHCRKAVREEKALLSLGTLGGGNHFIELDRGEDGSYYLVIHSGSRHLGVEAAEYYQKAASAQCREKQIEVPFALAYAEGELFENYVHDMEIIREFAALNRRCIADEILKGMKWKELDRFDTVHNYISSEGGEYMLRKGAVSAKKGEKILIPVNMKEGVLICEGKGSREWNQSAPHGSGRIASRSQALNSHTVSEFKKEMKGIFCSSIGKGTLDEAPFAYRPMEAVQSRIGDTADILQTIRPVYNFKAGDEGGNK